MFYCRCLSKKHKQLILHVLLFQDASLLRFLVDMRGDDVDDRQVETYILILLTNFMYFIDVDLGQFVI